MKLTRRQALAAAAGAGVAGAGCARLERLALAPRGSLAPLKETRTRDAAFLAKFGFGARPGELAAGPDRTAWLTEQLQAPVAEEGLLALKLSRMEIHQFSAFELRDMPVDRLHQQLHQAVLLRAIHSPWQLRERMVDFWTNHFNINARKGLGAHRKPRDEKEVIRAHALGSFPEMLMASAKSTAMLLFLDQQNSTAAQPNENYARELFELHSLGVDGGYSQEDVMEAARCFTGWSEERGFLRSRGSFKFVEALHDNGSKKVLGEEIPGGLGVEAGERVVRLAAKHPSTARHIARKLTKFLLGTEDEAAWRPVEKAYLETEGNISAMVRAVAEGFEAGLDQPSLKRPLDFVVSAVRALDGSSDGGAALQAPLRQMGQPLYEWPMPDGYPDGAEAWTGSLLARWNFCDRLTRGAIQGTMVDIDAFEKRCEGRMETVILGAPVGAEAAQPILEAVQGLGPAERAALTLASPEFQWR